MYSNNIEQIRAGLVNYIGAMLTSSNLEDDRAKKHSVVAILLEEAMNLAKDENGNHDIYVCKPALRLTANIARERKKLLDEFADGIQAPKQSNAYHIIEQELNKLLETIKL